MFAVACDGWWQQHADLQGSVLLRELVPFPYASSPALLLPLLLLLLGRLRRRRRHGSRPRPQACSAASAPALSAAFLLYRGNRTVVLRSTVHWCSAREREPPAELAPELAFRCLLQGGGGAGDINLQ